MRKFLFVRFTSESRYSGGLQCSDRNQESIETIFGPEHVITYIIEPYKNRSSLRSILTRAGDILKGYMGGLNSDKEKEILSIIADKQITDVFLDSSLLGRLTKKIRRRFPEVRTYTFFHNLEYKFMKDYVRVKHDFLRIYWPILSFQNEKNSIKYSHKIIALNSRDSQAIEKQYGRKADAPIPITFKASPLRASDTPAGPVKEALFIGSYFYPNVEGIRWLVRHVFPHVDMQLTIVGAGMDKLAAEFGHCDNIKIYSNVPDLALYFAQADFVVLPIFSGSGMKVKTAESLMNGKFIIGSTEALQGYEFDDSVARECNTADEFITAISNFDRPTKYNEPSRRLFEKKYSFEASLKSFRSVLAD